MKPNTFAEGVFALARALEADTRDATPRVTVVEASKLALAAVFGAFDPENRLEKIEIACHVRVGTGEIKIELAREDVKKVQGK